MKIEFIIDTKPTAQMQITKIMLSDDNQFYLDITAATPENARLSKTILFGAILFFERTSHIKQHVNAVVLEESNTIRLSGNIANAIDIFTQKHILHDPVLQTIKNDANAQTLLANCKAVYDQDQKSTHTSTSTTYPVQTLLKHHIVTKVKLPTDNHNQAENKAGMQKTASK